MAEAQKVFDGLAKLHRASLMRMACGLTHNADDAQDLVQDALARGWRFFERFDQKRDFRRWMYKVMSNLHIESKRLGKISPILSLDTPSCRSGVILAEIVPATDDHIANLLSEIAADEILNNIETLPTISRQVLQLSARGMSPAEIAKKLGLEVGTARSRLFSARKRLRATELSSAPGGGV
jgi:RNA polymerase sigma-70 factor (ECF subfamily)